MSRWLRKKRQASRDLQARSRGVALVSYPTHATPSVIAEVLEDAGYEVMVCEGPGEQPETCRVLRNGRCPLVERADVVICGIGLGSQSKRDIVTELRDTYLDTPIIVEVPRPQAEAFPDVVSGCRVLYSPLTAPRLLRAVEAALGANEEPGALRAER